MMSGCRNRISRCLRAGLTALLLAVPAAQATLTIEITRGAEAGMPIAVVPFGWQVPARVPAPEPAKGQKPGAAATVPPPPARAPQDIGAVIEADLARSGRFSPLPRKDFVSQPHDDQSVVFKEWRLLKAEALVIGSVQWLPDGRYQVQFRLYDVFKEQQLAGYRYTVVAESLRAVAHQIADIIHEKLTGEPGAFNTRIAYITREEAAGSRAVRPDPRGEMRARAASYRLQVADSDGYGPRTIVNSPEPLLSPAWSPDGRQLAYVSFEDQRPKVYIQNLTDGRRELLAEFRGINSAPAWSPDGTRLALTLSRDGNPEIYVLDIASRLLRRLTHDGAIDTEPAWSPDGRHIVFTSDRAGSPQIYRVSSEGGPAERMTFEGDYNARASYAPDGKQLVLVSGHRGRYHIAVLRLDNRALQVLTDTALDESPSFAPNGRMILYATDQRGRGVLASVSADGRTRQTYRFDSGDVREPAWSPRSRDLQFASPSGT
jgi:TolB protein